MQNFKKNLLKSTIIIFFSICINIAASAHAASVDNTLTDGAIVAYAGRLNVSRHVVKLEVDVPLILFTKTVFSASAVCIGNGEFLTNAHCLELWCNSKWQLIYPLFVENNGVRERVVGIRIHNMYTKSTKNKSHDIAYLRTLRNPVGIVGIEPTYRTPEFILGQTLTLIGFGASGGHIQVRSATRCKFSLKASRGVNHPKDFLGVVL